MSQALPVEYTVQYHPRHNLTLFRVEALWATNVAIEWGDETYPQYMCRFSPITGTQPAHDRKWSFGIGGKATAEAMLESEMLEMIGVQIDKTLLWNEPPSLPDYGGMITLLDLADGYFRTKD